MQRTTNVSKNLKLIFLCIIILAIIQVFVSNRLVFLDTQLADIAENAEYLQRENEDLQRKIASNSALSVLSLRAQESGYSPSTRFLYLNRGFPVALDR